MPPARVRRELPPCHEPVPGEGGSAGSFSRVNCSNTDEAGPAADGPDAEGLPKLVSLANGCLFQSSVAILYPRREFPSLDLREARDLLLVRSTLL